MNKDIKEKFHPNNFFDLNSEDKKMIFGNIDLVWEILPKLGEYIKNLFDKKIVQGNYQGKKDVYVGKGTVVQEGVKIIGPVIIGENSFIGHAALLRENCLLLDNVHIGHAVEVKNSIFLNNSAAAHLSYIGDSVVGSNVNISGGAIFANLRFDKESVSVRADGIRLDTHLEKFGSIIGDGSFIGVNAALNPGTVFGKNCTVYPLVSASGFYVEGSVIKTLRK